MKERLKQFIASDKFVLVIFVIIGAILLTVLVLVTVNKNQNTVLPGQQTGGVVQTESKKDTSTGSKPPQSNWLLTLYNFFPWLFQTKPASPNTAQSVSNTAYSPTVYPTAQTQSQSTPMSAQAGQPASGSNTSGGSNSNSNNTSSNPNATQFQIIFAGPGGQTTYIPPSTPPVQVTWATYTDNTYHYSIQYPDNWQVVNGQTTFAKGIVLFEPGENTNDPSQKYISFGWSNYNIYPTNSINNGGSVASTAMVTGVAGTIFTRGPIGLSYIVSVFPYREGYFGLITYTSDPTTVYIYQHMLTTLVFNQ